jgi:DNA-binding NarL/FixJ family response regulator
MAGSIRVLVVDDHPVARAGLSHILDSEPDITVVGEARDGVEAIEKALSLHPDVIIMDIFMPRCSGFEAITTLKQKLPGVRVLIITFSDRESELFQALRFGAQGYLLKTADMMDILQAVKRTAAGESMLSPQMTSRLVGEFWQKNNEVRLSDREAEVLQFLADGLTNREIARHLLVTDSTLRTLLRRLLEKLHLKNRAEAVAYAAGHYPSGRPTTPGGLLL